MTGISENMVRLTRLTVSNYRSIGENVSIDFQPLTVLVGINGSGKSNLLDAPRFIAHALTDGLESAVESRHGFDSLLRDARGITSLTVGVELEGPDWSAIYRIELGKGRGEYGVRNEDLEVAYPGSRRVDTLHKSRLGNVTTTFSGLDSPVKDRQNLALLAVGGDERLAPIVEALRAIETYSLFPESLRVPQPPSQRTYLTKFGENWSSILRRVMESPSAPELRLAMSRVTGDVVDVHSRRLGAGYLVTEFARERDGRKKWFEAARESDGTLRVAGILTALVQQPALTLVGIEEPEQTVHTGVLPILMDFLMEAAETSRAVVTTHSSDLLDLVPVDSIRVVQRISGTTTIGRLDEGQRQLVRQHLETPGEVLRSQGLRPQEA